MIDYIDNSENGLAVADADDDGLHIIETENESKVYVYYSEIEPLIQILRKRLYDTKHIKITSVQHSVHSKTTTQNAHAEYKSFDSYNHYMQSEAWQRLRIERLEKDNYRCVNCNSPENIEVHHLNYDNFGNESIDDVKTLCRDCHRKETLKNRRKKKVITE